MIEIVRLLKHATAMSNQREADVLDRLRANIDRDVDPEGWDALLSVAFNLRVDADRHFREIEQAERCTVCGCRQFADVDELKPDGKFAPGPDQRCVECKTVSRK